MSEENTAVRRIGRYHSYVPGKYNLTVPFFSDAEYNLMFGFDPIKTFKKTILIDQMMESVSVIDLNSHPSEVGK